MGPKTLQVSTPEALTSGVPVRISRTGEVLHHVRTGSAATTSQLATLMSMARSTVSERIDLLERHGLLVAEGAQTLGRGRPSTRYAFNASAGLVVAVQLGISGSRIAMTDLSATVLASQTVDTDLTLGPGETLTTILRTLDAQLQEIGGSRGQIRAAGLGVPAGTDVAGADLVDAIGAELAVPVYADQDVNLMALAEHRTSWPEATVLACVKVGTAIGCGVVIDGRILRGGSGLAGEIAHTLVAGSTAQCECGNLGCLNATASGAALVRRSQEAKATESSSARELAARAANGELSAIQAIRQAGREVGEVLAGVVNLLNPDILTVWGYLDDAGDYLLAGVRESIYSGTLPAIAESLTITHASLGDDAGVRGAATVAIEHVLEPGSIDAWVHRAETLPR